MTASPHGDSRVALFTLRGHLDDGRTWKEIGMPCDDLSACKSGAQRFTEYYGVVEVINKATGAAVFKASRRR